MSLLVARYWFHWTRFAVAICWALQFVYALEFDLLFSSWFLHFGCIWWFRNAFEFMLHGAAAKHRSYASLDPLPMLIALFNELQLWRRWWHFDSLKDSGKQHGMLYLIFRYRKMQVSECARFCVFSNESRLQIEDIKCCFANVSPVCVPFFYLSLTIPNIQFISWPDIETQCHTIYANDRDIRYFMWNFSFHCHFIMILRFHFLCHLPISVNGTALFLSLPLLP